MLLQYKILNNILGLKFNDNPLCSLCNQNKRMHLFASCEKELILQETGFILNIDNMIFGTYTCKWFAYM